MVSVNDGLRRTRIPTPLHFGVQLDGFSYAVECKTVFEKSNYMADALIKVNVYLRSSAPLSLNMSRLVIQFVEEVLQRYMVYTWSCWHKNSPLQMYSMCAVLHVRHMQFHMRYGTHVIVRHMQFDMCNSNHHVELNIPCTTCGITCLSLHVELHVEVNILLVRRIACIMCLMHAQVQHGIACTYCMHVEVNIPHVESHITCA